MPTSGSMKEAARPLRGDGVVPRGFDPNTTQDMSVSVIVLSRLSARKTPLARSNEPFVGPHA